MYSISVNVKVDSILEQDGTLDISVLASALTVSTNVGKHTSDLASFSFGVALKFATLSNGS